MATIDTNDANIPVWLVWSLHQNGNQVLNAICLSNRRANTYRKALQNEERSTRVRVWIEPREANHLFASMFEMLSDGEIHRLAHQLAAA